MNYVPPSRLAELEESATLKASEKANQMIASGLKVYKLDVGEPDFLTPRRIIDAAYRAMLDGYTHYAPSAGGGVPVEIDTGSGFLPDSSELRKRIGRKTKALIVNSPNNPTGAVYDEKTVKELSDLARENNLFIISDEIYDRLVYEGDYISFRKHMKYEDGLILVNGFSKAYAMTGWRLGYVIADEKIVKEMAKIQGHTATSPSTFVQIAAVTALRECEEDVRKMVSEFSERRKIIIEMLDRKGIEYSRPRGAFYFFIDMSKYIKGVDPAEYLLEKARVSVTSGSGFGDGYRTYIRISYATSRDTIIEGMNNIFAAIGV